MSVATEYLSQLRSLNKDSLTLRVGPGEIDKRFHSLDRTFFNVDLINYPRGSTNGLNNSTSLSNIASLSNIDDTREQANSILASMGLSAPATNNLRHDSVLPSSIDFGTSAIDVLPSSINFSSGRNNSQIRSTMHVHAHEFLQAHGSLNEEHEQQLDPEGEYFYDASSSVLSLPVISTLNQEMRSSIERMPRVNPMEQAEYEKIRSQYIEKRSNENPYKGIHPKWKKKEELEYHLLTEEASIVSLSEMSVATIDVSILDNRNCRQTTPSSHHQQHHSIASTHSNRLSKLEVVRKRKIPRKRRRILPTSSSIDKLTQHSVQSMRSVRSIASSSSLSSLSLPSSSSVAEHRSAILQMTLKKSRLQSKKITTALTLKMFNYRQKIPLELQGPGGCMVRVAAILKAANGRRLLQLRVNAFGHWRLITELLRRQIMEACAIKLQCAWRAKTARTEWDARMDAARRQRQQLLLLQHNKEERENHAEVQIAKIMRGWYQKTIYQRDKILVRSVKIVQRLYRCRLARKDLFLRIVGFKHLMENATTIQCAWRIYVAFTQLDLLRRIHAAEAHIAANKKRMQEYERHFQMIGSACVVQTWWRGCVLMLRAKYQIKAIKFRAANTCQRWWRGCFARHGVIKRKRVKYDKKREVQNAAASKIQRAWKMKRSRKRLRKIRQTREEMRKLRIQEKEDAMLRAQGGTVAEKSFVGLQKAGRFLFRNARGLVAPNLRERSALKIQCAWRGYEAKRNGLVRQKLFLKQRQNRELREKRESSALKIQTVYRGHAVRVKFGSIKGDAASTIQATFRLYHARQWYKRTIEEIRAQRHGAAEIVQKAWRRYSGRTQYLNQIMSHRKRLPATILVQQYWRRYTGRRRWLQTLEEKKRMHEDWVIGKSQVDVLRRCLEDHMWMDQMRRGRNSIKFLLQRCFHFYCGRQEDRGGDHSTALTGESISDRAENGNGSGASIVPLEQLTLSSGSKFKNFAQSAYLTTTPKHLLNTSSSVSAKKGESKHTKGTQQVPSSMSMNVVDTIFSSKKGKHDSGLTFEKFIEFLHEIADRYYCHERNKYYPKLSDKITYSYAALRRQQPEDKEYLSATHPASPKGKRLTHAEKKAISDARANALKQGPQLTTAVSSSSSSLTLSPWLVGYSGSDARILRLLDERVLRDKTLHAVGLGRAESHRLVDAKIGRAARIVQNRWRGVEARAGYMNAKESRAALLLLRQKMAAATVLQTNMVRPFLARRCIKIWASNLYIEYRKQDSTGKTWYNPRTKRTFSPFPPPLLTLRVVSKKTRTNTKRLPKVMQCQTSMLPHLDKMFTLPCSQCIVIPGDHPSDSPRCPRNGSELFCVDCEESFCQPCYDGHHHSGMRKEHQRRSIPLCQECTLWNRPKPYDECQIATIHVRFARKKEGDTKMKKKKKKQQHGEKSNSVDMGDESQLCDECWNWIVMPRLEEDGRLDSTMTKRLVATCMWCEDYAARWSCIECAATSRSMALAKQTALRKASAEEKKKDKSGNGSDDNEGDGGDGGAAAAAVEETLEPDLYCHSCYEETHSHGKRAHHRSTPVPYYPLALQLSEQRETREQNDRRKYRRQLAQATKLQQLSSRKKGAVTIQKYWRRFVQRRKHWQSKKNKRKNEHKKWAQKRVDDEKRRTCGYRLRGLLGKSFVLGCC